MSVNAVSEVWPGLAKACWRPLSWGYRAQGESVHRSLGGTSPAQSERQKHPSYCLVLLLLLLNPVSCCLEWKSGRPSCTFSHKGFCARAGQRERFDFLCLPLCFLPDLFINSPKHTRSVHSLKQGPGRAMTKTAQQLGASHTARDTATLSSWVDNLGIIWRLAFWINSQLLLKIGFVLGLVACSSGFL